MTGSMMTAVELRRMVFLQAHVPWFEVQDKPWFAL